MAEQSAFLKQLKQYVESERFSLPVFDPVSLRIQLELVKKDPNLRTIEKLITGDQALSGNLLKVANSPLYRGLVVTTSVRSALTRLGLTEITRIVLAGISKRNFRSGDRQLDGLMKKLWQHSMGCAFAAGMLSNCLDFGVLQHEAFTAGLMHDIGKLLILKVVAERKKRMRGLDISTNLLVEAMDSLHAEQGYLLLKHIHMPESMAVISRDHHLENVSSDQYVLLLVRLANRICHQMGIGLKHEPDHDLLMIPDAQVVGLKQPDLEKVQHFLITTPELFS
ncbi:HDOD domain-containing protein [Desulfobulbus oligotrophicus]|jgi:HD-like signal output (HDOD) protein|uniref:HDOD domain-containing protein n=1 Tax=Desulfobulbus oligotrophicus TaxID=1909699 RepID=A0A7T6AQE9_9BACT|nr:HDOD domain-containing protein [Desulfobulbus oligotrophicus]MDY0389605.1 HDOD domain-containing protein [Desulfobulbus oligotrophicus]QQG65433.1 HDOD domain-containing protein [Desulfobulbus oligotrophicus]